MHPIRSAGPAHFSALALLVLLLVLSALPTPAASPTGSSLPLSGLATASSTPATARTLGSSALEAPSASSCATAATEAPALWDGAWPAPSVDPSAQSPCAFGPDESSLSFLSNASGAGEAASFTVVLPPSGSATGSTIASISFRMWTSGVLCSRDGATQVVVQLLPPASPFRSNFSATWALRAPAYDLAPPSSCDPVCTNDTALVTMEGTRYCEDQIVREVPGGPPLTPTGSFLPGDTLQITFTGTATGIPLAVYVNDTSRFGSDLSFTYTAGTTLMGRALLPLFSNANLSQRVWGLAPGIAAVATNCPVPGNAPSGCLSYNRTVVGTTTPVSITSAKFRDTNGAAFLRDFDAVATVSSTGSCAIGPIACSGFADPPGGFYPYWSLHAIARAPAWEFGGEYPSSIRSYGGPGTPAVGIVPTYEVANAIGNVTTSVSGTLYHVRGEVTDPSGINAVLVSSFACEDATGNASVTGWGFPSSAFASPYDGTFDAQFGSSFSGQYPYWIVGYSNSGHASAIVRGSVTMGGATACVFPAPSAPVVTSADITAIAGGYRVRWNGSDPLTVGYLVNATAPSGASTLLTVGAVNSTVLDLGAFGISYNLSVSALNAVGGASAPSLVLLASPTAPALTIATAWTPPGGAWLGSAVLNISGVISGGVGPYELTLAPGDGASVANDTATGNFTFLHDLGGYWGEAVVRLSASDAVGDTIALGPYDFPIFATPHGAVQLAQAGDFLVNISYSVPASRVAPMTGYAIVTTTDPALAWELGRSTTSNYTVAGITVWNTTRPNLIRSGSEGVTLFAQVFARNSYGVGWLPGGDAILAATPSPLALSPISTQPGGRAPFTDTFSASVTGGTNDSLFSVLYSFPSGAALTPAIEEANGTFFLNTTFTFPGPGSFVVVLHVVDIFYDVAITTTTVYVSPGVSPSLSADLLNAPAYAGTGLYFQATASGGSSQYAWNWSFGDGDFASAASPFHVYATSGDYTVLLSVTDIVTSGTNATTLPIVVYAFPVPFVSVTPGPNGSLSYDFQASVGGGSGPSVVVWTFGDGGVAHGALVSHDFRAPGTYSVNVTATDPSGRAGTREFNLSAFATTGSGGASNQGFTELDVTLIVAAAGFGILALLLARRRGPVESPPPRDGEEDGEVSLT